MVENKKRINHCFNCGEETEDYEEMPNGRRVFVCASGKCERELRDEIRAMEDETRGRANEDGYSRYY